MNAIAMKNNKIKNINKEEENNLIKNYREGSFSAFNLLYNKYFALSKKLGRDFYYRLNLPGLTEDELVMVCVESFYFALLNYSAKEGASFFFYWKTTALHEIGQIIEENKRFYKNCCVSLDSFINKTDGLTYGEVLAVKEDSVYDYDSHRVSLMLSENDTETLNELEKKIVMYRTFGDSFRVIGEKTNVSSQRARLIYNRAIKKMREHICATSDLN